MRDTRQTHVERGAFPFPATEGPEESRYLAWIRNHANYMAVRGLSDYARALSVLVRGIVINALIYLPILLAAAGLVAARHLFLPPFFYLTVGALILGLVCALGSAWLTPHFRIARHRMRLDTGSDSTVQLRDRVERVFGQALLVIAGIAIFELLAFLLGGFHQLRLEDVVGGFELASIAGLAVGVLAVGDRVVKALGGTAQKLAILGIGLLGVLLPVIIVMIVGDFLAFGLPIKEWTMWYRVPFVLFIGAILSAVAIGLAVYVHERRFKRRVRSFARKDRRLLVSLLVSALAAFLFAFGLEGAAWEANADFREKLHAALDGLDEEDPGKRSRQIEAMERLKEEAAETPGRYVEALHARLASYRAFRASQNGGPDGSTRPAAEDAGGEVSVAAPGRHDFMPLLAVERELERLAKSKEFRDMWDRVRHTAAEVPAYTLETGPDVWLVATVVSLGTLAKLLEAESSAELVDALVGASRSQLELLTGVTGMLTEGVATAFGAPVEFIEVTKPLRGPVESAAPLIHDLETQSLEAREELSVRAHYSRQRYPELYATTKALDARIAGFTLKSLYLGACGLILLALSWLTVDINLTSIHGLYRDRLASAFLVGADTEGDVDVERDLDLGELSRREAGSIAPYHLVNVALNLQGSRDMRVHDRKSDFFVLSKRFIGGERTGYCRSERMELVFPQMDLASAMAISAGAASPNMGRATSPALIAIMVLLNVRLGYWLPNPGRLEEWLAEFEGEEGRQEGYAFAEDPASGRSSVFAEELLEVQRRWEQLGSRAAGRGLSTAREHAGRPAPEHGLVGIGFSGGGIRSATVNLGIAQALHAGGVFDHADYMSSVSGGGYLASSLSALMREKTPTTAAGPGEVEIGEDEAGRKVVSIHASGVETERYVYEPYAQLAVGPGARVEAGQRLLCAGEAPPEQGQDSVGSVFHWRVPPRALWWELIGSLNETRRWVNISDGGHIENLAAIELLRRQCRYVILGDAEADPEHEFAGLATLIRTARIDLGVHIQIDPKPLRLGADGLTRGHWTMGRIHYPPAQSSKDSEPSPREPGYLLYLKSSVSGDEDEVIRQYRRSKPSFPHEATADQFFSEGQFEAYRSLGQHIARQALPEKPGPASSFVELEAWFRELDERSRRWS